MADYEDIKVKDLVINNMSQEKFDELKAAGELQPDQIYFTPESDGASLPDQTGNTGKFLTTDGTTASWSDRALVNLAPAYMHTTIMVTNSATSPKSFSVVIGRFANTTAENTLALGYGAVTNAEGAIQLNASNQSHTNSDPHTFKVANKNGNFEIMSADGTIPAERMSAVAGTTGQVLTKTDSGMEWQDVSGGSLPDQTDNAGKFLMTDGTTASWGNALANNGTGYASIGIGEGAKASSSNSIAIGTQSISANIYTTAVGPYANAILSRCTAIGYGAVANAVNAIQLGQGTNTDANTFKVGNGNDNFELMDANGNVPRERLKNLVEVLPTADNSYTTVKNYGNGYVEITGYTAIGTVGAGTGSEVQIDLPAGYTMADTNYWVNIAPTSETTMFDFKAEAKARSTTHFMVAYKNEDDTTGLTAAGVYWEVRGMLATA